MNVSQKCQYALRAVFELAKRSSTEPTTVAQIAKAQAIPARFLESILGELRQGGFTVSRRGAKGGFFLAVDPAVLSVGQIIEFIDGPVTPVKCLDDGASATCELAGQCAFMAMWTRARDAVTEVYDTTTFSDLVEAERAENTATPPSYCI